MHANKIEEKEMKSDTNTTRIALLEHITQDIGETLKEIKIDMREMRNDIQNIRREIKIDRDEIRKDIHEIKYDMTKFKVDIIEKLDSERKYIGTRSWVQFGFLFSMVLGVLGILARSKGWL